MELIVEMRYGSHLYGTDTPQSDVDLKSVYLPEAQDILLQRVKPTIVLTPQKPRGQKNAPGEVDRESYSLQRFLALLAEGQTMALDMLFAPESAMTMPPTPLWREIQASANRLISRRAATFLGYCRRQANTYGVKGSRVAAARKALSVLEEAEARLGGAAKLGELAEELQALAAMEHIAIAVLPSAQGKPLRYLEVCGHKAPFTASIKNAREIAGRLWRNTATAPCRPSAMRASTGRRCRMPYASAGKRSSCSKPAASCYRAPTLPISSPSSKAKRLTTR